MTGHGGSLRGDTLHSAAVTEEGVCVVVEQLVAGLVEDGGRVPLSNGKTDSVGKTLAEGASGDLDTGGVVGLRVTRGDGVNLLRSSDFAQPWLLINCTYTEVLQVVHADAVAEQVEQSILEHAAVTVAARELVVASE